jgi:hypothetical protein
MGCGMRSEDGLPLSHGKPTSKQPDLVRRIALKFKAPNLKNQTKYVYYTNQKNIQ